MSKNKFVTNYLVELNLRCRVPITSLYLTEINKEDSVLIKYEENSHYNSKSMRIIPSYKFTY